MTPESHETPEFLSSPQITHYAIASGQDVFPVVPFVFGIADYRRPAHGALLTKLVHCNRKLVQFVASRE